MSELVNVIKITLGLISLVFFVFMAAFILDWLGVRKVRRKEVKK